MTTRPRVAIFDVNETVTDLVPLRGAFEEIGLPGHLVDTWYAGLLRDGIALTAAGGYADFADVAAGVLKSLLPGWGGDPDHAVEHVMAAFTQLHVHPDIPEGMRMLRDQGIRLFTLTVGVAAITEAVLARDGIRDLVEECLDVSGPRAWKPARASYAYALGKAGVRPDEAVMIAVHPWDIDGAQRAGLHGAWLDRQGTPYPPAMLAPEITAPDLIALASVWA
ncbi:dehalogenase [Planotetraspora thailandica]|uniref:Dehalogenase n=1 Tax=Planotetraspora thailandica TaxID=487172 RepID=A0A8J3Y224_9ACTN|nr:haloacid dehalogenase type II [Planotetraspora thailandica]GII59450.1 dehalogenase [Planotetraspora thailandica]